MMNAQESAALERLVSPFGVISGLSESTGPPGMSRAAICGSTIGAATTTSPPFIHGRQKTTRCSGRAVDDPDHARLVAIAEGAERYAGGLFADEPAVLGTAEEMDGPILDPARIPRCSPREYATPGCPLTPFDSGAPIHWVQGVDLVSGKATWVPAVMAHYGGHQREPERFWFRISTGYAVHFDPLEALFAAACEVIERDMISIVWLQRMNLPRVPGAVLSEKAEYLVDWAYRHFIETHVFDATSDMAVPTAYCVQTAVHDARARNVVGCATGRSMTEATEKAVLDASLLRGLFSAGDELPQDFANFTGLTDGSRYMAMAERAHAFDFLLRDRGRRSDGERAALPTDPGAALTVLIDRIQAKGMQAVAVDRTTGELESVGLTAVNVVIPDLQPLTMHPYAQYRAHPRLYQAPREMGYVSHPEEELNPWPNPFA